MLQSPEAVCTEDAEVEQKVQIHQKSYRGWHSSHLYLNYVVLKCSVPPWNATVSVDVGATRVNTAEENTGSSSIGGEAAKNCTIVEAPIPYQDYRCGCIIAVLYPWYSTIVLYNSLNCALYYTAPSELWTLSDDHYYGDIEGRLFALHKNPTGASGGGPNAFIVAHELGWASTRSRPGPPFCSIQNNSIVKPLQWGIDTKLCKWL